MQAAQSPDPPGDPSSLYRWPPPSDLWGGREPTVLCTPLAGCGILSRAYLLQAAKRYLRNIGILEVHIVYPENNIRLHDRYCNSKMLYIYIYIIWEGNMSRYRVGGQSSNADYQITAFGWDLFTEPQSWHQPLTCRKFISWCTVISESLCLQLDSDIWSVHCRNKDW